MPSSKGSPNPGIEPRSLELQVDSLPSEPPGKPKNTGVGTYNNSFIITKAYKLKPKEETHGQSLCVCCHFSRVRLWDSMDCSLPGSSIHGILQARILEWVAMPSSRESSPPGIKPTSLIGRRVLYHSHHQGCPKCLNAFLLSSSEIVTLLTFMCDNMYRILPTRETNLSFSIQRFYCGFITESWLVEILPMWLNSISRPLFPWSWTDIMWPKVPHL